FIPHSLLHSAAGLVGQAFGLHGPGAGVGGTPASEADVLRAAAAWLAGGALPRAWLVWAGGATEALAATRPGGGASGPGGQPGRRSRGRRPVAGHCSPSFRRAVVNEPIWITGIGVGTPHGWTFDAVADGLLAGRSAVHRVTGFDVSQHPAQIGSALGPVPAVP